MPDDSQPSMFEIVQRERNEIQRELDAVYHKLAHLSGWYSTAGSVPVAEIRALVPGLNPTP